MIEIRKKYPVTHKGKEYEVRWEQDACMNINVNIYEVTKTKLFKIKRYKYRYGSDHSYLINKLKHNISISSSTLYIEEIKLLFTCWEEHKAAEQEKLLIKYNKEIALTKWNGVID